MPVEFWPSEPPPHAHWTLSAFHRETGEYIGEARVVAPPAEIAQAMAAALARSGVEPSSPEIVMCYGLEVDAELIEFLKQYTDEDFTTYRVDIGMQSDSWEYAKRPRIRWGEWASDDPDDRAPGPGRYFLPA
jgi:hypothetical protein